MPGRLPADRLRALRGLYAIVGDEDPVATAQAAIGGGARVVQVRMKRSAAASILEASRRIVHQAQGKALVIVNDRVDLAILAGADGVHVGEEDLPVAEARRLIGPDGLVGRTCRTLAEVQEAVAQGADHVGFGPIFESHSKTINIPPRGIERLREATAGCGVPVVAIGGITLDTIGEVAAAGAAGAAVIDDLLRRGDVQARAFLLASRFDAGAAGAMRR